MVDIEKLNISKLPISLTLQNIALSRYGQILPIEPYLVSASFDYIDNNTEGLTPSSFKVQHFGLIRQVKSGSTRYNCILKRYEGYSAAKILTEKLNPSDIIIDEEVKNVLLANLSERKILYHDKTTRIEHISDMKEIIETLNFLSSQMKKDISFSEIYYHNVPMSVASDLPDIRINDIRTIGSYYLDKRNEPKEINGHPMLGKIPDQDDIICGPPTD